MCRRGWEVQSGEGYPDLENMAARLEEGRLYPQAPGPQIR